MTYRNLTIGLALAGIYIGGAFALKAAATAGLLPQEASARVFRVFMGLTLAVYANYLPKMLGTFRDPASAMCMESVLRVGGWAITLGGLGYAIASVLPVPATAAIALLGTATAYVLGYALWAFMGRAPGKARPT